MTALDLSPEATEEEVAEATERWLRDNLPPTWLKAVTDGDREAIAKHRADEEGLRLWFALLGDSGLATPRWPREYGGLGLASGQAGVIAEVLLRYSAQRSHLDFIALALSAPGWAAQLAGRGGLPSQISKVLGRESRAPL